MVVCIIKVTVREMSIGGGSSGLPMYVRLTRYVCLAYPTTPLIAASKIVAIDSCVLRLGW